MRVQAGDHVTANVRLVEELGAGGMGSVWVAEHLTLKNRVAVKFILVSGDEERRESAVKRFSREAALAAQIQHPHVVQMFDHGVSDAGLPYIVMELLEGESLKERLAKGALTTVQVRDLLTQIAKVLERAHSSDIIHRDLKPANLFLVDSGYDVFVKVLDFGIAKQTSSDDMELTESSALVGTPMFMSKEALRGREKLDHRADLWSLGVVVYHALTRRYPFQGETFAEQVLLVHDGEFVPVSDIHAGASPQLDAWFEKCFATNIDDRWQSAGEMAAAFVDALASMDSASQPAISDNAPADALALMSTVTVGSAEPVAKAAQSTLGGASTTTTTTRRPRALWMGALALLGTAGVIGMLANSNETSTPVSAASAPSVTQSVVTPPIATTSTPEPTASASAPAAKASVSLRFDAPPNAEVLQDGKVIGKAPGPIEIAHSDQPIELEVRARGRTSKTIEVTPDGDKTVKVVLPVPVRAPKPSDGLKW